MMPIAISNLVSLVQQRAEARPDDLAYVFLSEQELLLARLTYKQFDLKARTIAAFLQSLELRGERALLLYPPGLEFVAAFMGCIYGGVIAVPAYPPRMNRNALRLASIAEDCQASVALTTAAVLSRFHGFRKRIAELENLRWVATDTLEPDLANDWRGLRHRDDSLAYLQYTSGSTTSPRGVMVTHGNVLHNSSYIAEGFAHTPESISLCWLPHFHDMGLIDGIIQPLYSGFTGYLMSPTAFLQKPLRWLETISRYRVTHSGGPNFAYELCSAKISTDQRDRLDLSSWKVAYNGAEPVHAPTIEQFTEKFAPCGFRRSVFYPAYGLAEATLKVAGGNNGSSPVYCNVKAEALERDRVELATTDDPERRTLVGSGCTTHGMKAVIVDPVSLLECASGQVGEIWVQGPSVAAGYWRRPEETEQVFKAVLKSSGEGPFLRTGDLGFAQDDELFVTGRLKNLIIIRGRNHYPQDIELTMQQCHPVLRGMAGAAFSLMPGTEEKLALIQEIDARHTSLFSQIAPEIQRAVAEEHEIQPNVILLVKPGDVPRTSSGKVQHHLCRQMFLEHSFKSLAEWRETEAEAAEYKRPDQLTFSSLQLWLQKILAATLRRDIAEINSEDPVCQFGLDSLAALELSHSIETTLGIFLSQSFLLEGWNIGQLTDHLVAALDQSSPASADTKTTSDIQCSGEFPLSQGQQALWFLQQLAPESLAYHIVRALRLKEEIDVEALRWAFQLLVDRHASLRTVFTVTDDKPVQQVREHIAIFFIEKDASHWNSDLLQDRVAEIARQPFNLSSGPLFKIHLFRRSDHDHLLLLSVHHMVADLWSLGLLLTELSEIYTAAVRKIPAKLPPLSVHYADYIRWEEEFLKNEEGQRQWHYWQKQLGGDLSFLDLPADFPRPAIQSYRGATEFTVLDAELARKLKSMARSHSTTLYTLLVALVEAFLHRYTGQDDVLVGTPATGRSQLDFAGVVGYFVNPVVIRMDFSGEPAFEEIIIQARRVVLEALKHQAFPLATLVQRLQPQRDLSRSPLFQAMFVFQKTSVLAGQDLAALALGAPGTEVQLGGLRLEVAPLEQGIAQFDLTIAMAETGESITASIEYSTDLFEEATIERMVRHFQQLLHGAVVDPALSISEISLLDEEERRQVLFGWNQTEREYPAYQTVLELLEQQAQKTPHHPAVIFEGRQLTYGELHQRANQLAHYLQKLGVGPEVRVGVCMERSAELVIALLAILKAGGAYLPLDSSYPAERLNYMLHDAQVNVLLATSQLTEKLKHIREHTHLIDLQEQWKTIGRESREAPASGVVGENLTYLIYTSGSTGQPKGVMSVHRGLLNRLQWVQEIYRLDETDRILQKTPFGFDVSVWEFFWPLMYGACLVMARAEGHKDSRYLVEVIQQEKITTIHFVPSMLQVFLQEPGVEKCSSLRRLISSGEALPVHLAQEFQKRLSADLHNLYGPTEASIEASHWACPKPMEQRTVPIGRPIANTQLYILDTHLQPVPVSIPGELHIGGVGLARGYWSRADLTAEKFIPDPFSGRPGARLYRTGDLARWRTDGTIEFLGRNDFQVKIRGFRVELGEIETCLAGHPSVSECAVMSGESLIAYYIVNTSDAGPGAEELRAYLSSRLPEYMVPSAYVLMQSLPLTSSGKLDRKALPAPTLDSYAARAYEAPLGSAETTIAAIWADLLQVERVGRHDNFFALGGHSLMALTLIERMRHSGLSADAQAIFATHSLVELAAVANKGSNADEVPPTLIPLNCVAITPEMLPLVALSSAEIERITANIPGGAANVRDIYPLTPLQQGILFHSVMDQQSDAYTVFALLSFDHRGCLDNYLNALQVVVDRHDILRTCILWEGLLEPLQVVQRKVQLPVEEIELDLAAGDATRQLYERFHPRSFRIDVRHAPLLRIYIAYDAGQDRWLMVKLAHHLIGDNTSLQTMFQEIQIQLVGMTGTLPVPLPFRNLVAQARLGNRQEEHEAFLRRMLAGFVEPVAPFGILEIRSDGDALEDAHIQLSGSLAQRVRKAARGLGMNAASLFHMAWAMVLSRVSGKADVVFGTVLFGRMSGGKAGRVLGPFINTLPMRVCIGEEGARASMRRTHALLVDLLRHEHAPLTLAQSCSAVPAPMPLFTALLNYRHSGFQPAMNKKDWIAPGIEWLYSEERSNYPFILSVDDPGDAFHLSAQAPGSIGPMRLCEFMQTALMSLVEALEHSPHAAVCSLEVLTEQERRQVLLEWNQTREETPQDTTIVQMIEGHAALRPQALAVRDQHQGLSCQELNQLANQWARRLRKLGVQAESRVAVCMERGIGMVAAQLGVLKASGAYIPLDREQPAARLQFQISDSRAHVVIADRSSLEKLRGLEQVQLLCIEEEKEVLRRESRRNPEYKIEPEQLAYVIYTSGSTGRPKGVEIGHRGLLNLVHWHQHRYGITPQDRGSQVAGAGFDASVWETWPYLAAGASLEIAAEEERISNEKLRDWLAVKEITVAFLPTPLAAALIRHKDWKPQRLRTILTGGDRLQDRPAENWSVEVVNHYGPTESTVVATSTTVEKDRTGLPAIGRPISNIRVYVLDAQMRLVPVGAVGELYIGGVGLARGYAGKPDLTAEHFVPDALSDEPGARLYRTGDQCRWNSRGELEFVGRIDQQIKIRGYRIEIGEIETVLKQHGDIRDAVVTVQDKESGDKLLVAYVVPATSEEPNIAGLRQYLQNRLPSYMVPSAFMQLDEIPLTPSGKPDRQALKKWQFTASTAPQDPRNKTEALLAQIWQDLLRVERAGIHDNFFELGGDSIISLQIVARAQQHGIRITPRQLFDSPTIAALAATAERLEMTEHDEEKKDAALEQTYPLSPMQKGMLFESLSAPESGVYIQQLICMLRGDLDILAFQGAWQQVVQRHSGLCISFQWEHDEEPVQHVCPATEVPFEFHDWNEIRASEQEQQFQALLAADRARGFTLSKAPLLRLTLLQIAPGLYKSLFTFHHLILDGWSLPLLFKEVFAIYEKQVHGTSFYLPSAPPYSEYIHWLQKQDFSAAESYWRQMLQSFTAPTLIPAAHRHNGRSGFFEQQIQFSSEQTAQLQSMARQQGLTLSILVEAAWSLLLSRYSGEDDVVFGITLSGRSASLPHIEERIGLFINTLPVRACVHPRQLLLSWLNELQAKQAVLAQYEHTPLLRVQKWSGLPAGTPLFESIVVIENYPLDTSLLKQKNGLIVEDVQVVEITNYPLTVTAVPHQVLKLLITYDRGRFDDAGITRMLRHLENTLLIMAASPRQFIGDVTWITPAERSQLLYEWNQTHDQRSPQQCIHKLFEEQAKQTPNEIAVTFSSGKLTYAELNQRANQLAHYLLSAGVTPESYVGLCAERSLEMTIGILGILKAGGVYTPVDPSWPSLRKTLVLAETQALLLLTSRRLLAGLEKIDGQIICMDSEWEQINRQPVSSPVADVNPDNLAYVIYTSGTTGKPKGVMVSHGALCNHLRWMQAVFSLTPQDCVPQKYSLSFDVSLLEIFYPLLAGARLAIAPPMGYFDFVSLMDFLIETRITAIDVVPSMLQALLQDQRFSLLKDLRQVTCGGEVLPWDLQKSFLACSTAELANLYGPTETTIGSTFLRCRRDEQHLPVSIGRPISNTRVYILDREMEPVPVSVAGELYIGGIGLARGYLHEPALTAENFVPHCHGPFPGERLYRTGDRARYCDDGNIEYLGRADHQLKVRGFRIEPGEIEAVLRAHPAAREAVVLAHQQQLIAYVVGVRSAQNELRQHLKQNLPEYMVPARFAWLDEMPLLPSGKVNRKALPVPATGQASSHRDYVAPRTAVEAALATIWSAVLKAERISVEDNFFELGGDSIISLQIVARARQHGISINPRQLFECPSIAALAAVVERMEHTAAYTSDQRAVQGEVALTPIQRWFFEQEFAQPHHYNQAVLLEPGEELNSQWLELAWQKLVEHHDALRLRYSKEQAGWRQWNAIKEENQFFQIIEASGRQLDQMIDEMQKGLDMERGPLLRVAHVKPNLLAVVIHHLAIDGVSWRILLEDLESAYWQLRQGREIRLPAKTTSYQKWAEDLLQAAETARYQEELEYWLGDEWQTFDKMPKDTGSGSNREADRGCVKAELDEQQTRQLLQDVPGIYHTQINDVLLAAMLGAWQRWTGKDRLLIDLEGHGRESVIPGIDCSRTVGWFTIVNPVMLSAERSGGIGQRLKTIKERLRQVPGRGIGYGVLRYTNKGGAESTNQLHQQPGAEISFNYLGQLDAALLQHGLFRSARLLEENSRGTNNQRSHLLEVEARVHRGRLQVQWIYSREIHHRTTIELLANHFIAELSEIIQHCLAPGAGGFTPSDFPLARLDQQALDLLIHKHSISDIYPLSSVQQGLLFHTLYDGSESGTYVEQISCSLWGRVGIEIFQQAWQQTIDHHPALRTGFIWEGFQEPLQIVHASACAQFVNYDWRPSSAGQQQRVEELARGDVQQGFDLSCPPLMRFTLVQLEPGRFEFIWTSHHLLLDGWSMALVLQEVLERYSAMCRGTSFHPAFHRRYRDYIAWIRQQDLASAEAYWRSLLRNFSTATPLPGESTAESGPADENHEQQMTLSSEATARLQTFAQQHQVTLNVLIQTAWAFLLRHYSGEEDLLFGVTVSGRPAELAGVERMVGVFINTLPVRTSLASDVTVFSVLKELQEQQLLLDEYAYTPLSRIQEWSEIPPGRPLFGTVVVFENYPVDASLREGKGELRFSNVRSHASTNYPLTFVVKLGEELTLQLAYDSRRYDARVVAQLLIHLNNLLAGMAADPMQRISDLRMLSQAEHQQLLVEWNRTATNYPRDKSIQQLFEEHVSRAPRARAVVFEDRKLSYEELNAQANQVAHYLVRCGIRPETRVGVCMERSLEMIVALLGILKAGGGYVALEPSSPDQRLQMMFADSHLRVILTQQNLRDRLSQNPNVQIISLDEEWESIAAETRENPRVAVFGEHLAYVSYTSGSTGKPKGVSVPHRGVVRLVKNNDYARLEANEVILQFAPLAFDASTLEIWGSLLNGGRLVILPPGPCSAEEIAQTLVEHRVTTLWLTAGLFHLMVDEQLGKLAQVRQLLAGGDILSVHHVNRYLEAMRPDGVLIDGYGPTENTTFTCCHTLRKGDKVQGTVPIGRPIRNTQVFVLNQDMQPVGVGVAGELYIAGAGLARGYESDAALTADKFVPHPYGQTGERLYRSGDQVRYRADGTLQFVGRKDRQVKVRGYRVEPAEIEWALRQHHSVRDVVVTVQDAANRDKSLVAYVVMDTNHDPAISILHSYLKTRLPDYMSPAAFVFLEKLPLTPNGKVDYRALPRSEIPEMSSDLVFPRTPVEQGIAGIWKQVFGREKLGIHDNFFDLGGHSLLALQIVSRVRTVMGVALPLRSVFERPTIADQARTVEELLSSSQAVALDLIRPAARPHDLPLSFAQQRLWFLHQLAPTSDFYNVPVAFRVRGPLNIGILGDCFHEIIGRHEVLRTAFPIRQGVPLQQIHEAVSQAVTVVDLAHLSLNQAEPTTRELLSREAQQPFDLSCGLLLRLHVVRLAEHDHALLLNMHHIIVDGWSLGIFMQELRLLYEAFRNRRSSPLPPLSMQYADYALWQREWLSGERLQSELSWWEQQLSDVSPAELPTDFPRPKVQTYCGARRSVLISPHLLESVTELAHKENSTVFMLLLAVFKVLMFRYTNQADLTIGTPVAGRNQEELEPLIGFFVNTLVLRTTITGQPAFREFLHQVRETSLGAYAHQNLPFEKLVEELPSQADRGRTPFFQAMFALEDTLLREVILPGLEVSPLELETQSAQFDLTVAIRESLEGLHVSFRYNTDLFEAATIERMMRHFQQLLSGIVTYSVQPISEIPLLSDEERRQILLDWNQTKHTYSAHQTLLDLLEQQAKETPENPAVMFEGRKLSYRELHQRANQLARFLRERGVGPEGAVGICAERSELLVIALLGIMKAGAAFVPLDPSLPSTRLAIMIRDSQARLVLAQESLRSRLPRSAEIECMDQISWSAAAGTSRAIASGVTDENPAYILYTSGSTGVPKGVVITHRGLYNHMAWMHQQFPVTSSDRVLQKTPFGFDASVWEFWAPLIAGAILVVARPGGQQDPEYLVRCIQECQITVLQVTPMQWRMLLEQPLISDCQTLKRVFCGGEALNQDLVNQFSQRLPWARLYNLYGPTEATIDATFSECVASSLVTTASLGGPIANTKIYVLDQSGELVPAGVPGELYIGGAGLARGYVGQPALTAQRFLPDPFSHSPGARLYRTGDLVRWRAEGNLEYLGRLDRQVKLRGYRIELGEIEAVLTQHPEISQTVVALKDNEAGEKRLAAYVVSNQSADAIREYLRAKLPEYMIPSIVSISKIPLTLNGKIDYNALPAASQDASSAARPCIAPRTAIEEQIAHACCDLLSIQSICIHDNFFDLGGHSLLAMRLLTWIRESFQAEKVPLRGFFETPTVAGLAALTVKCEPRPGQTEKIAKFLQQLNAMSPEEVTTLRNKTMATEAAQNAASKS
jgi:amino acid adenylation domain-containing protein/non-ribosomal peptide synthase protein (TIGR01720 family)